MTANVGSVDRILRIVVGLLLIAWATGILTSLVPSVTPSVWGWIGVVPLFTALVGFCPAYTLLGMNTCARKA